MSVPPGLIKTMPAEPTAWPEGELYHSALGVFGFQIDGTAQSYVDLQKAVIWDTGLGKTHLAMYLPALLAEAGDLTCCLILCERNKTAEWSDDFAKFTRLDTLVHHGPGRDKRLLKYIAKNGRMPRVLISTPETIKLDTTKAIKEPGKRGTTLIDNWLMPHLLPLAGGLVVVYDEIAAKLSNRTSMNYKSHHRMISALRRLNPDLRVIGLTATPIGKGYEDAYNQFRITHPQSMPLVREFEADCVKSRDIYGRPTYRPEGIARFIELTRPFIHRKRKTDPDVIDQFPAKVEESHRIEMSKEQEGLYALVEGLGEDEDGEYEPPPGLWMTLRQVAAHPASLTLSEGKLAALLTQELGAGYLRSIPSAKTEELVKYLTPVVLGQDEKVVVFSFFGQSVLPLLATALRSAKIKVYVYHGSMTGLQRDQARVAFRTDPEPCVFLTSDAGARGINLPEASYVVEYESALTHQMREQRINRCSRIDGGKKLLTCMTFVLDESVEVPIMDGMLNRNLQQDIMRGDVDVGGDFVSAADRRELLRISHLSRRSRR